MILLERRQQREGKGKDEVDGGDAERQSHLTQERQVVLQNASPT